MVVNLRLILDVPRIFLLNCTQVPTLTHVIQVLLEAEEDDIRPRLRKYFLGGCFRACQGKGQRLRSKSFIKY